VKNAVLLVNHVKRFVPHKPLPSTPNLVPTAVDEQHVMIPIRQNVFIAVPVKKLVLPML
jgi:hypothetical protein